MVLLPGVTPWRARSRLCQSRHSLTKWLSPQAGRDLPLPLDKGGTGQESPVGGSHKILQHGPGRTLPGLCARLLPLALRPPLTTSPPLQLVDSLPLLDVPHHLHLLPQLTTAPGQAASSPGLERLRAPGRTQYLGARSLREVGGLPCHCLLSPSTACEEGGRRGGGEQGRTHYENSGGSVW